MYRYLCLETIGVVLCFISLTQPALDPVSIHHGKFDLDNVRLSGFWKAKLREAVDGAGVRLRKNFILVLTELSRDSLKASRTFKYQIGSVLTAIVSMTFDFSTVIVSTPKILTETLPVQLISILKAIQLHGNVTRELNSTIGSVIDSIREAESSNAVQSLFLPTLSVVPNLMQGVNRFLVLILSGVFALIGAQNPATFEFSTIREDIEPERFY